MKNIDNHIREILSDKLGNLESEVSPHLWNGIESQLAQQAAASGTTAAAKSVLAKWLMAAAITASVTVATVLIVQNNQKEQPVATPTEQTTTPSVAQNQTVDSNSQNNSSADITNQISDNSSGNQTTSIPANPINQLAESVPAPEILDFGPDNTSNPDVDPESNNHLQENGTQPETANNGTPVNANGPLTNPSYEASNEKASANFSPIVVSQKDLRYFFIPEFTQGTMYEWNMGDGTIYDTANPTHEFDEDGEYTILLNVTDKEGNSYSQQKIVKAYKPLDLKIPNIFTPNGAGFNDEFKLEVLSGQVEWTKIVIRNNTGIVFESNGDEMWKGQDRHGNDCPDGTYTYQFLGLDRNQAVIEKTGIVTLRR